MKAIWEIEQLQLRGKSAFINGWLFVPHRQLLELNLQLRSGSDELISSIPLQASKPRPDVLHAHPMYPESRDSGFVGIGSWPRQPERNDRLILHGRLNGDEALELAIPLRLWGDSQSPSSWQSRKAALRQWLRYLKRGAALLSAGQLASLTEKVRRQLSDAPQQKLFPSLQWSYLESLGAQVGARIHLIIDHRLGGGANHYAQQLTKPWLEAGDVVLTLTFHIAKLQPILVVETAGHRARLGMDNLNDLCPALATVKLTTITYNTAVSFVSPELIPGLLLDLRRQHQAHLTTLLHDYFCICPSQFLLNSDGHFCGIPELDHCRLCLHRNPHGFTSLFQGDVSDWREAWGPLLQESDEILAFSSSSAQLLRQAYESWPDGRNWLQGRTITLKPHAVNYLGHKQLKAQQTERLVIGIVGQIGFHKGAELIKELANTIEREDSGEQIAIIGTLEGSTNPAIVKQSGPYKRHDLAAAIEKSGANVMLFPSVWPETFSYVTQEIIELNLPLACLDLGAPAERVKDYPRGVVLASQEPSEILQSLRRLLQDSHTFSDHQQA